MQGIQLQVVSYTLRTFVHILTNWRLAHLHYALVITPERSLALNISDRLQVIGITYESCFHVEGFALLQRYESYIFYDARASGSFFLLTI